MCYERSPTATRAKKHRGHDNRHILGKQMLALQIGNHYWVRSLRRVTHVPLALFVVYATTEASFSIAPVSCRVLKGVDDADHEEGRKGPEAPIRFHKFRYKYGPRA
jgi:hypothetical protein